MFFITAKLLFIRQMCLLLFTFAVMIADLREYRIPNRLILTGLMTGLGLTVLVVLSSRSASLLAVFLGGGLFPLIFPGILYYGRMMGAGDIKMLCVIGFYLGLPDLLRCLLFSFVMAGVISLALMIRRNNLRPRLSYFFRYLRDCLDERQWKPYAGLQDAKARLRFSVPVFLGVCCTLLFS